MRRTIPASSEAHADTALPPPPRFPADCVGYLSLPAARGVVTRRLAACELPSAFIQATVAAAANAFERDAVSAKASRRRLLDKATKLAGVES